MMKPVEWQKDSFDQSGCYLMQVCEAFSFGFSSYWCSPSSWLERKDCSWSETFRDRSD